MIQQTERRMIIVDEYWRLVGDDHSALKARLRELPGVRNATYLVDAQAAVDRQVFVFDKLVRDVASRLTNGLDGVTDADLQGVAIDLMEEARMSAIDAVTHWYVAPRGLKIVPIKDRVDLPSEPGSDLSLSVCLSNGFLVVHEPFDAIVAQVQTLEEGRAVVADLLVRGVPLNAPMRFRCDLNPAKLADVPEVVALITPGHERGKEALLGYGPILASLSYLEGCQALTPGIFNGLNLAEKRWSEVRQEVERFARVSEHTVWSVLGQMALFIGGLADGAQGKGLVDEEMVENASRLQQLYPELSVVSPSLLYSLYDEYQDECLYISSWEEPSRDRDFALYVIGQAVMSDAKVRGGKLREMGAFFLYAHHQAKLPLAEAMAQTKLCSQYDACLTEMVGRAREILVYLMDRRQRDDLVGPPVVTWHDALNLARKRNSADLQVAQSAAPEDPS